MLKKTKTGACSINQRSRGKKKPVFSKKKGKGKRKEFSWFARSGETSAG